jgi:hypothetical protein
MCIGAAPLEALPSCRLVTLPQGNFCDGSGFDALLQTYAEYLREEFEGRSIERALHKMQREDILGEEAPIPDELSGSESDSDSEDE